MEESPFPDTIPDMAALPPAVKEDTSGQLLDQKHLYGQLMRQEGRSPAIICQFNLPYAYRLWEWLGEAPADDEVLSRIQENLGQMLSNWRAFGFHPEVPGGM